MQRRKQLEGCLRRTAEEELLQQLQNFLLHSIGLGQGTDAGLTQNLVLRQVRSRLTVIRRHDVVLRRNHIRLLGLSTFAAEFKRIDLRSQVTALGGYIGNRVLIAVSAVCASVGLSSFVLLKS